MVKHGTLEWLRELVSVSGVSQRQIAEEVGKSESWVSAVLAGKMEPPLSIMEIALKVKGLSDRNRAQFEALCVRDRGSNDAK